TRSQSTDLHISKEFAWTFPAQQCYRPTSGGSLRVTKQGTRLLAVGAIVAVVCSALASAATAQVSSADQKCITTFNKGLRKVAKTQGQVVSKCIKDFASGRLLTTVESCVVSDPGGKLQRAIDKA